MNKATARLEQNLDEFLQCILSQLSHQQAEVIADQLSILVVSRTQSI